MDPTRVTAKTNNRQLKQKYARIHCSSREYTIKYKSRSTYELACVYYDHGVHALINFQTHT